MKKLKFKCSVVGRFYICKILHDSHYMFLSIGAGIKSKVSPLIDSAGSRYSLLLKKIMQC